MKFAILVAVIATCASQCSAHVVKHVIAETDKTIKDITRVVSGGLLGLGGIRLGFGGHVAASAEGEDSGETPRRPGLFGLHGRRPPPPPHHSFHIDRPGPPPGNRYEGNIPEYSGYPQFNNGDPGHQYGLPPPVEHQNGHHAGSHNIQGGRYPQGDHNYEVNNQNGFDHHCEHDSQENQPNQANGQDKYGTNQHGGHKQLITTEFTPNVNDDGKAGPGADTSNYATKTTKSTNEESPDEFAIDVRTGFDEDPTKGKKQ